MTAPPGLQVHGLRKRFGGITAVDDASMTVASGELHALIGPNGAGKTTFIQLVSGAERADGGRITLGGVEIDGWPMHRRVTQGLARSFQISSVFPAFTVLDNIALAVQARSQGRCAIWRPVVMRAAWFDQARHILDEVGLGARSEIAAGDLSHGERRRLEIGLTVATGARVLLLDEPLAGLGADESGPVIELLQSLKDRTSVLLVEHDMDAVFRLADRISVLVSGRVIATGTPLEIRAHPEVRRAYLGESTA
ncbi:ABC transporter ATP-binding protein [Reyranella sp. CPCC 100927]|uniref:ABC transporter ATP-binding protein n=1 Tax=Reyranella sp. CPCC 100927 TaxID=2599616 RepID=UPI0011B58E23|nr:ABC transporter ATP-binding protein [Reyranella sp. CPCC 100927]TWT05810.1 ABC transporter ATP-binding protein [Reyranella sp. CPCC 100927]